METTRRNILTALAFVLAADAKLMGKEEDPMREILENSQTEKKSVMLYVKGQNIGGVVVKLNADTVELRNREYGRIVVRIDSIDAAAMV